MLKFGKGEAELPSPFPNFCMYLVLYLIYRYFPFHVAPSLPSRTSVPPAPLPTHTHQQLYFNLNIHLPVYERIRSG